MLAFQSGFSVQQPADTTEKTRLSNKQIKDYVVITTIIVIVQYLCCKYQISVLKKSLSKSTSLSLFECDKDKFKSTKQESLNNINFLNQPKMDDRLNIGREVRELKLGSTFDPKNSQTAFHTLKYDFKPMSVDLSKVASLDVSSNNQVTVTVPNIESSGVPHTVFKGNQRKYTKECIIIFDRKTGVMTLEKLNHNIQVKKTRSEIPANKNAVAPPPPLKPHVENSTQRVSTKTKVSTGVRKNAIIGFVPRSSPMQQGSPSYPLHKSPQSAPAWIANNGQSTLPSIPIIGLDDDIDMSSNHSAPPPPPPSAVVSGHSLPSIINSDFQQPPPHHHQQQQHQFHHQQLPQQQHHHQQQQQQQQQQQHHHHHQQQLLQQQQHQQQLLQQNHLNHHHGNSSMGMTNNVMATVNMTSSGLTSLGATLESEIGVLSSSDSSSESESSDSASDSDDSVDNSPQKTNMHHQINNNRHHQQQDHQHQQQSLTLNQHHQSYENGSLPALLHDDLQLSESNSSDSDDD